MPEVVKRTLGEHLVPIVEKPSGVPWLILSPGGMHWLSLPERIIAPLHRPSQSLEECIKNLVERFSDETGEPPSHVYHFVRESNGDFGLADSTGHQRPSRPSTIAEILGAPVLPGAKDNRKGLGPDGERGIGF